MSSAPRSAQSRTDDRHPLDAPAPKQGRHAVRGVLWLFIALGALANAVTSFGPFHTLISVGFGLLTVLCIVLLVMDHVRHRG